MWRVIYDDGVFVVELPVPVTVYRHPFRQQQIEDDDFFLVTATLWV